MNNIEITTNGETVLPSWTGTFYAQPFVNLSCAIVGCTDHANPLNTVEATLDVFGSPVVRVCLCDAHFHLFGQTTEEHEKPDIVIEEQ